MCPIKKFDNKHSLFYLTLGPYLSRKEIVKELGSPVWDEENKLWFVALSNRQSVMGFCAVTFQKKWATCCSDFVLPHIRRQGIYKMLFKKRFECLKGWQIRATATDMSKEIYLKAGFYETGKRGRFYLLQRRQD